MTTQAKPKLSPHIIAALDVVRSFSAIYVVIHHLVQSHNLTSGFGVIFKFGSEAVIVFFLISGFVIYANESHRSHNFTEYYYRRVRRIYPAFAAALVISCLIALDNQDFYARFSWTELIGNLANLQDIAYLKPGVLINPFLKNEPLWSLSYEVVFYAVFPLIMVFYRSNNCITDNVVGVICCFSYIIYFLSPGHFSLVISYFLIWWTGAMAAKSYLEGGRSLFGISWSSLWLIILFIIAVFIVYYVGFDGLYRYPFLQARHFGFALIVVFFCFSSIGQKIFKIFSKTKLSSTYISSISYGLYLFHFPLVVQSWRAQSLFGLFCMTAILILASHVFDREINNKIPRSINKHSV